jgi:hypothetical protein
VLSGAPRWHARPLLGGRGTVEWPPSSIFPRAHTDEVASAGYVEVCNTVHSTQEACHQDLEPDHAPASGGRLQIKFYSYVFVMSRVTVHVLASRVLDSFLFKLIT